MTSSEIIKPMIVKMKLTLRIYARASICPVPRMTQRLRPKTVAENATVIDRRYRKILTSVVTDRFDRAAFHRFFAESFFLGRFGLLVDVGVTAVVVAFEIRRCSLPA